MRIGGTTLTGVLAKLKDRARPDQVKKMSRFGISARGRLGVSMPDIRKLAREIGKNHDLALELWSTGIPDARILASLLDVAREVTGEQMESWVRDFESWDVCDQVCMNLFDRVPFAREKVFKWSRADGEFVKRAAFTLIASLAVHDKQAPDGDFLLFFPVLKTGANDDRNYVRKAVSWALRSIGKRNLNLNRQARSLAREIQKLESRAARWIAADVLWELRSDGVQQRIRERGKRK